MRHFGVVIALSFLFVSLAHASDPYTKSILDDQWSTFGYIGSTSEPEADRVLGYACQGVPPSPADALALLRDEVATYVYLQAAVIHPEGLRGFVAPENCFSPGLESGASFQARLSSSEHLQDLKTAVTHELLARNLWADAVALDRTDRDLAALHCANQASSICVDTMNRSMRFQQGFPAATLSRSQLLSAVEGVIGNGDLDSGTRTYEDLARTQSYDYFQAIFPVYKAITAAGGLWLNFDDWSYLGQAQTGPLVSLRAAVANAKERYYGTLGDQLRAACHADFATLAAAQPMAVRQLLLDAASADGSSVKRALCDARVLPRIATRAEQTQQVCGDAIYHAGFFGGRPDDTVGTSLKMRKQSDGSYLVQLVLGFKSDPSLNAGDVDAKLAEWQQITQAYYNCLGGNTPSPAQITLPVDAGHRAATTVACRRAGPGERRISFDFRFVRSDRRYRTVMIHPAHAPGAPGMREDIANWEIDSDDYTALHETGHWLGLPDEYSGSDYRDFFPLQGEYDSLMRTENTNILGHAPLLYPRHFEEITLPADLCGDRLF
jgi:hypothetical protein